MRLDDLGVTLTMLRFVVKVNARTRAAERAAGGDGGATAAIADDREPDAAAAAAARPAAGLDLGRGLAAAKFVGKLQRARTREVARQQAIAREAALREDTDARRRGRSSTFVAEQTGRGRTATHGSTLGVVPEDGQRAVATRAVWVDAATELKWDVCERQLQDAAAEGDVHRIRLAVTQARELEASVPMQRFALADMEDRVAKLEPRSLAEHAALLWAPGVVHQLNRFWDVMAVDLLTSHRGGNGRWSKVHGLLVSKRAAVALAGYARLYLRISKAMHQDDAAWDRTAALEFCTEDWLGDVARFGGSAAMNAWFAKVKRLLVARSQRSVKNEEFCI